MNSRLDTQAVPSLARGGGSGDPREPQFPPLQPHFLGLFPPGSAELSPKSGFESMIFPKVNPSPRGAGRRFQWLSLCLGKGFLGWFCPQKISSLGYSMREKWSISRNEKSGFSCSKFLGLFIKMALKEIPDETDPALPVPVGRGHTEIPLGSWGQSEPHSHP